MFIVISAFHLLMLCTLQMNRLAWREIVSILVYDILTEAGNGAMGKTAQNHYKSLHLYEQFFSEVSAFKIGLSILRRLWWWRVGRVFGWCRRLFRDFRTNDWAADVIQLPRTSFHNKARYLCMIWRWWYAWAMAKLFLPSQKHSREADEGTTKGETH